MKRRSKHTEIYDLIKSFESPMVKWGYLDTKKQSNNTEIQEEVNNPSGPLRYPVVECGYLDTTDQSVNADIQEKKKHIACNYMILLCAFAVSCLAIIVIIPKGDVVLFFILIIYLALLLYRIRTIISEN